MKDATLPPDLRALAQSVRKPEEGFFGPGSYAWRLLRENTIQLAGPYAALMQVAHPHVAQGVAEHSKYDTDPIGRLQRTFRAVHKIVFGTVDDALEAALHSRHMHARVKGTLPEDAGGFQEGTRYHANRIDLLLWVHATLVEGAIMAHERFIRTLKPGEREGLYQEFKIFGMLFGIPDKAYPQTYRDFQDYYADMVARELAVSTAGRDIADNILYNAGYYKFASPLIVLVAAGTLPPRLREEFGLPWNAPMAVALEQFTKVYRQTRRYTLNQVLYRRAYLRAIERTGAKLPVRDGGVLGGGKLLSFALR